MSYVVAVDDNDDALVAIADVEREVAVVVELMVPSESNDVEMILEVAAEPNEAAITK